MFKTVIATLLLSISSISFADQIKILVGFPPGGGQDLISRIVDDHFNKQGIRSMVINKPGASGMIALNDCEQDAQYLCMVADAQVVTSISMPENIRRIDYDKINYVKPVAVSPIVLVTGKNNIKSYSEVINDIRNNKVAFGSGSNGLHNETLKLLKVLNVKQAISIEYKGNGPAALDIIGGHVQYGIMPYAVAKNNPNLRIVAVSRKHPYPELKEFPVLEDQFKNLNTSDGIFGFVVSSKTPDDIKRHYTKLLTDAMMSSAFKEKLFEQGFFIVDVRLTDKDYKNLMDRERIQYVEFLKTLK